MITIKLFLGTGLNNEDVSPDIPKHTSKHSMKARANGSVVSPVGIGKTNAQYKALTALSLFFFFLAELVASSTFSALQDLMQL